MKTKLLAPLFILMIVSTAALAQPLDQGIPGLADPLQLGANRRSDAARRQKAAIRVAVEGRALSCRALRLWDGGARAGIA